MTIKIIETFPSWRFQSERLEFVLSRGLLPNLPMQHIETQFNKRLRIFCLIYFLYDTFRLFFYALSFLFFLVFNVYKQLDFLSLNFICACFCLREQTVFNILSRQLIVNFDVSHPLLLLIQF